MDNTDRGNKPDHADGDLRPAAVTFVTTEHFTLQGCPLVDDLGVGWPGERVPGRGIRRPDCPRARRHRRQAGVAFYMFGLILLPALAFVGLATFHRVLQSGLEDLAYARRIAQLRDYYFDHAPELAGYLLSPAERLPAPGAGDRPVAAIRDRRRDGRRDHRGTGRFGWGAARGRSFWPLASSGAGRRRGRRRCGTDRADAVSEFGLAPGQHGIVVPWRRSRATLNPPGQSARCTGLRRSWVAHRGRR